jgi:hypothetical protein
VMLLKSAVFWGITRCRVVNSYHMTTRNTQEDGRFQLKKNCIDAFYLQRSGCSKSECLMESQYSIYDLLKIQKTTQHKVIG